MARETVAFLPGVFVMSYGKLNYQRSDDNRVIVPDFVAAGLRAQGALPIDPETPEEVDVRRALETASGKDLETYVRACGKPTHVPDKAFLRADPVSGREPLNVLKRLPDHELRAKALELFDAGTLA